MLVSYNVPDEALQSWIHDKKSVSIQDLKTFLAQYQKNQRIKNDVPLNMRCNALKNPNKNGVSERCTRSRHENNQFCKTHMIRHPFGIVDDEPDLEITSIQIKNVLHYIDNNNNIYDPLHVIRGNTGIPRIVGRLLDNNIVEIFD